MKQFRLGRTVGYRKASGARRPRRPATRAARALPAAPVRRGIEGTVWAGYRNSTQLGWPWRRPGAGRCARAAVILGREHGGVEMWREPAITRARMSRRQ